MDTNGKELIYHYTTGGALLGMLKDYEAESNPNLTMWATHYMYMNDPFEFRWGIELCKNAIIQKEKEANIDKDKQIGCIFENAILNPQFINETHRQMYRDAHRNDAIYIVSFSRAQDSLNMWNMYAQNGNGLALGFKYDKLKEIYNLQYCNYVSTILDNPYIKIIHDIYTAGIKVFPSKDILSRNVRLCGIVNVIYKEIAPYIKNIAYRNEEECRIIYKTNNKTKFREKNGLIIPYTEQAIPFDCLDSIIVGPTADFERAKESILMFLYVKGIQWDDKRIIQSEVPYRN